MKISYYYLIILGGLSLIAFNKAQALPVNTQDLSNNLVASYAQNSKEINNKKNYADVNNQILSNNTHLSRNLQDNTQSNSQAIAANDANNFNDFINKNSNSNLPNVTDSNSNYSKSPQASNPKNYNPANSGNQSNNVYNVNLVDLNSNLSMWAFKDWHNQKSVGVIGGYTLLSLKNSVGNPASLHVGLSFNQNNNFEILDNDTDNLYGEVYAEVDDNSHNHVSYIGFFNGPYSKTNINQQREYDNLQINGGMFKLLKNPQLYFDGSYMQYNNALALEDLYNFLGNTLSVGYHYLPSFKISLASEDKSLFRKLYGTLGAIDAFANYYNETGSLGYGFLIVGRNYITGVKSRGLETLISPNIDYLGFGLSGSLGIIKLNMPLYSVLPAGVFTNDNNDSKYNFDEINRFNAEIITQEVILTYNILSFGVSVDYNHNIVRNKNLLQYHTSMESINLTHTVNSNFKINLALFNTKLIEGQKSQGFIFGFTIKAS